MDREKIEGVDALSAQLNRLEDVTQFNDGEQREADVVAEGLLHIADSARAFQNLLLRLREPGLTEDEQLDLLWDIGEELRHMDEHVHDMAYFDAQINGDEAEDDRLDS
jgi:hypothetical protein